MSTILINFQIVASDINIKGNRCFHDGSSTYFGENKVDGFYPNSLKIR